MKYFPSFLVFAFLLCATIGLSAQDLGKATAPQIRAEAPRLQALNILPVKQMTLLYEVTDISEADMLDDPENPEAEIDEDKLAEQVFDLNVLLHLFSTGNISKIHAKIGTSLGAADHAQYSFNFDEQKGLPAPFTFARDGKTVVLGMGQVKGLSQYYVEIVMEGLDGKKSEPRYINPE